MKVLLPKFLASNLAVFSAVMLAFGAVAAAIPPILSPDSRFYISLADAIRAGDAGVFLTTKHASWTVIVFPLLLALTRSISPEHWPWLMVLLNAMWGAITAATLVSVIRHLTRSVAATLVGLLFFVAAYDVVAWLRFVLTDMIYTALAMATFAVAIRGVIDHDRPARRRILLAILLVACFVTRPSGVILIPLVILTEIFGSATARQRKALWMLLAIGAGATLFVRAWFFDDMQHWPVDFMRPKLEEYAAREDTGEVVWGRTETFRPPPQTLSDHLAIEVDRFVRFFQITTAGFSRAHNLINLAYYGPLYLLALIGVVTAWRDPRMRIAVQVTLLWIAVTAWFHALTILDFDWRYRLPVMPLMIVLASCGVVALARKFAGDGERATQPWPAR